MNTPMSIFVTRVTHFSMYARRFRKVFHHFHKPESSKGGRPNALVTDSYSVRNIYHNPGTAMMVMTIMAICVGLYADAKWIDPADTLAQYPPQKMTFQQRVDHSSFKSATSRTFTQRYWVYDKFWRRPTNGTGVAPGPILFFFSGEGGVDGFYQATTVLFSSLGPKLQGLSNASADL